MDIARGSTFDFTITLPEEYDISDALEVWVSFGQGKVEKFTKSLNDPDITVSGNLIQVHLSQEDTLALYDGEAQLQTRILTAARESLVQEPIINVNILPIIKDGAIHGGV